MRSKNLDATAGKGCSIGDFLSGDALDQRVVEIESINSYTGVMSRRVPRHGDGRVVSPGTERSKVVEKLARRVTGKAYSAALETGHPVMVVRDGWICNVYKSGQVERVRAVDPVPDLRGRTFSL